VGHARHVLIGEHSVHAGQGPRLAHVNALDVAMRDRAVKQLAHQHAAQLEVRGEGRLTLHQLHGIHLGHRRAHMSGLDGRHDDLGQDLGLGGG